MGKHDDRLEISLPAEQKENWKEFEEQTDAYSSLADLVRKSVEKEIGLEDRTREFGEMKEELVSLYSNLNIQVNNISDDISDMQNEIPSNEELYDIGHDSTIDAVDKVIEDSQTNIDDYRRK